MAPTTFESLPIDVLLHVFEFLDARSILRVAHLSRHLHGYLHTQEREHLWHAILRRCGRDMPVLDPRENEIPSLQEYLRKCAAFHRAWTGTSTSPDDDTVRARVESKITVPEKVCMIRILPGGRYVMVVDTEENAQLFERRSGAKVGSVRFTKTADPEILYSLDFLPISRGKVLWGVLTSDNLHQTTDAKRLCVRAIIVSYPEEGSLDRMLRFETVLEEEMIGSAEMMSLSYRYLAAYSYQFREDDSPTLMVWDWHEQIKLAQYRIPWRVTNDEGGYAGHPALHVTQDSILLIGGQLGVHAIHAIPNGGHAWNDRAQMMISSEEDATRLRFSSQGRCSRQWYGHDSEHSWHRLLSSPSRFDDDDAPRPLRVLSFQTPTGPEDKEAQRRYMELGEHLIAPGFDNSPQLFHVSRFGTKAIWFAMPEDEMIIQSVSLPSFDQESNGAGPSPIKRLVPDAPIMIDTLRAFDTDETCPLIALADEDHEGLLGKALGGYESWQQAQGQGGGQQQPSQNQGDQNDQRHQQHPDQQGGQNTLPVDHGQAAQIANNASGDAGNSELFSQAMSFLSGGNHTQPVDEQHVTESHKQLYGSGDSSNMSASSVGSAAALQTLKSFMGGGGQQQQSSGGSDFQTKMIGMAMSEAATMYEKNGGQGDKQDAVNGAAATMFKLLVQSKLSGSGSGGSELASLMGGENSGGLGSLLSMASKFTK